MLTGHWGETCPSCFTEQLSAMLQEMEALLAGSGPLSDSLRRNDPYHPPSLSTSPPPLVQQGQQAQHPQRPQQQQQQNQSQQPIKVSLLPGPLKLLTPTQVKELSWQNHLKLFKVAILLLHPSHPEHSQPRSLAVEPTLNQVSRS